MSAFIFSALSNTTTWTDSNFSQDTTNYNQGQVVSQTAGGGLHALASSLGGTGIVRAKLTGRVWGTTIGSKVTLNGVRSQTVTDDVVHCLIVVETGANAWKGYLWAIGPAGFQRLGILNSGTDFDMSDSPNASIAAPTSDSIAEGDTLELSLNTSTGAIVGKHNGTQITSATDTTYSAGLCAGFLIMASNHGGTGISRLDTTGDSPPGTTITPSAGGTTVGGNTPTVTSGINTVVQPFVARRSGLLEPYRRIVLPRSRKIFLPGKKKAA